MGIWKKSRVYSWRDLCDTAEQLHVLLQKHQVPYWAEKFTELNTVIQSYRAHNNLSPGMLAMLKQVEALYGGMGSFSDFSLDPRTGVKIESREQNEADKHLYSLRSKLYEIATALSRAAQSTKQ